MSFLPWILVFCLFFFVGVFFMIYFGSRSQEKALETILQQIKATRLEVDRLAGALDALLAERELDDDAVLGTDDPAGAEGEKVSPAIDRLLLGLHDTPEEENRKPGQSANSGSLPDLRL